MCDDVVASIGDPAENEELAVIHLTWSGRSEQPRDGIAWPYFERVTRDGFVGRFCGVESICEIDVQP